MSRLAQDGTAEPVSLDQILRREREKGKNIFPCSAVVEQDFSPVDSYSAERVLTIHTRTTPRRRAARMLVCHIME